MGAFKYYVTRDGGSGVFKQGGASVQIYAPPLRPRDGGFAGVAILLIRFPNLPSLFFRDVTVNTLFIVKIMLMHFKDT